MLDELLLSAQNVPEANKNDFLRDHHIVNVQFLNHPDEDRIDDLHQAVETK